MQEKTLLLNEKVSDFSQEMDTITDGYCPNLDKPFQISKEEELDFRNWFFEKFHLQMRIALVLGAFLYISFWGLDWLLMEDKISQTILIRGPISFGILCVALWVAKWRFFKAHSQTCVGVVCGTATIGLIGIIDIAPIPVQYLYYAGLLLIQIYATIFVKLFFENALKLNILIIGFYVLFAVFSSNSNLLYTINNLTFLISTAFMTLVARYWSERSERIIFLQEKVLSLKNKEVENQNRRLLVALSDLQKSSEKNALFFAAYAKASPGTSLEGKYLLLEQIGSGGLGTVYKAVHKELEYEVAIKLLKTDNLPRNQEWFSRMKREAILSTSVHHPNAIKVFDFAMADDVPYIVMELLNGKNVEEILEEGVLSLERCAQIILPVCDVLEACHQTGIVHRDVKPSNIFLHQSNKAEVVKLIDFGIAKNIEEPHNSNVGNLTCHGTFVGTPNYAAPELLHRQEATPMVDAYAVGVMLFEMLTQRFPFETEGQTTETRKNITPIRQYRPSLPPSVERVILSLLEYQPERRGSLGELRDEMSPFQSQRTPPKLHISL